MFQLPSWIINIFMFFVRLTVETYTKLTLPIYYLIQKPWKILARANEIRATQVDPQDPYSEWVRQGDLPYHPLIDCETVGEAMQKLSILYDMDRPSVGYREILEEQIQRDANGIPLRLDGKVLKKYKLTDYKWLTYGDILRRTGNIGRGFLLNGLERKEKILFLADTCVENFIFSCSIVRIGVVGVSVFTTLDDNSIVFAINETQVKFCYTTCDLLSRILKLLPKCPLIETIVYVEGPPGSEPIPTFPPNIKLFTLSQIEKAGELGPKDIVFEPLEQHDHPIILYTSGTTGTPKGIYPTGEQMRHAGLSVLPIIKDYIAEAGRHCGLAFLPQAHIFEASLEVFGFLGGAKIGFGTPFTFYENAPGLADGVECDLKLLKPTLFAGVPLVLERMRKQIYEKLKTRTPVSTALFDYLMQYKINWTQKGYDTPIVNMLLCSQVRSQFGGKIEHMAIGSAPIAPDLQALIKAALNIKILMQGYGLTETCGAVMAVDDHDLNFGHVGAPLYGVRAKLVDWEEGGYTVKDKPNPRGELVIGGKGIASGYYKNEKLTNECFKVENGHRYLYTGDIAEVLPDGRFKIIDRKKDLVKLANGEYFSLGKIEAVLKCCQFIDNICIFGDALRDCLVAFISPHHIAFTELVNSLKINKLSSDAQCSHPKVNQIIYKSMKEFGLANGLRPREIPKVITITSEVWSPDNELLTAAMKLKRRAILSKYEKQIEQMFSMASEKKENGKVSQNGNNNNDSIF